MKKDDSSFSQEEKALFDNLEVRLPQKKEELWAQISEKLESPKPVQRKLYLPIWAYAVAASVLLLVASTLFARYSTTEIQVAQGEHDQVTLPDGSTIDLNAESALSYHPYWWRVKRELQFEGEAFFEVKKGESFRVNSHSGSTKVLGTSFTISTRNETYRAYCSAGKVEVSTPNQSETVELSPGMAANIDGDLTSSIVSEPAVFLAWKAGDLHFENQPLDLVIQEIERQYAVKIAIPSTEIKTLDYSGSFKQPETAKSALNLICLPLGLEVKETQPGKFTLTR